MRRTIPTLDAALLVVAVLAVSTSGPLVREAAAPTLAIAFWRTALASALIVPLALHRSRDELRGLARNEVRTAAIAGVFLMLHFGTWIPSLSFTSVASSVALTCTQPVWAAVMARVRGEHIARGAWLGIGVALCGALLLTGIDFTLSARALFGGAEHIERVDCLVRRIAAQQGLKSETLDEIVALVDERLKRNRAAGAS